VKCLAALVGRLAQELPNGTFNLIEGGIAEVVLGAIPAMVQVAAVFRFEFTSAEVAESALHHLHTEVLLNGNPLGPEQVLPMLLKTDPSGGSSYFNALLNLQLHINASGVLRIITRIDGFGGAPSLDIVIKAVQRAG
jgi:hypothetical protein